MPPHPLTNFEIQKYCQNEPKFNGVYVRDKLPKMNDVAYVIDFDQYKSIGTHWIVFYVNDNNVKYFDSLRVEQFIGEKNFITDIYAIQFKHTIR